MRNRIAAFGLLPLLLAALPAQPAPATTPTPVGVDTLLRRETDLSQLPRLRDWASNLQSSYDRTGGNGDAQNFLAVSGTTATLADLAGPGAVVRLWSANPNGRLKIYIDDIAAPVIDVSFAKLFDGSLPALSIAFAPPLTQASSGGFYCYLPIPYAKHCRITVDGPRGLYYQVNSLAFAPHTAVRPFALPLAAADQAALLAAARAWSAPGNGPPAGSARAVTLGAGRTQTVGVYRGPGTVRSLGLAVPRAADLRRLVLRGYFDGHATPDIEAPVADFFGSGYGHRPFTSLLLSQSEAGAMTARFPMPFAHSARFTLENGVGTKLSVVWNVGMTREPFHPADTGYFHAFWSQEVTRRGLPHVWARARGQRGHFVGIVQTMAGARSLGFLEGDDQFRVDAQSDAAGRTPTTVVAPWNGTGTEDCFNSGWYFSGGPNALPVNGALVKDQSGGTGRISAYRWFLNDAPVFQHSLDARIEHGGANDAPDTYYSSVAYWYSSGPTQPWSRTPRAALLGPPHNPRAAHVLTLKDPIEGESLVVGAQATAGKVQAQDMSGYPAAWSGDSQLWWTGDKIGDTLALTLPPRPGAYDLVAYFTRAADYGQFTFTLNGEAVGGVYDAYHDGVAASGPVSLGRVILPAGPSLLVVTVHGRNDAATNTLFGLDALELKPVK